MAKSDSFFIRHTTEIDNDNTYHQDPIDLGAYVDALGKSVLRIHNIAVTMSDSTGRTSEVTSSGSAPFNGAAAQFQLLTQTQADIVLPSNKSLIASGRIVAGGNGGVPSYVSEDFDNLPQLWTNGYLVAVDTTMGRWASRVPSSAGLGFVMTHLDDILVRLVVDLHRRDRLLHVPEDHVEVLVIRVELAPDLPLAPQFDVHPLVQGQADEIERLLDRGVLLSHLRD